MRIYDSLAGIKERMSRVVLVLGVFDGFHLGHQRVMARALAIARRSRGRVVVFTFRHHPLRVVDERAAPPILMTAEERLRALCAGGAKTALMVRFDRRLQSTAPDEFVRRLLEKLDLCAVVVGPDFRFGGDRAGGPAVLRRLGRAHGFRVAVVPALKYRGQAISSSRIRQTIVYGFVGALPRLLGRYYGVRGTVTAGDGVGRTIGAPTLNLSCPGRLLPKIGVYLVRAKLAGRPRTRASGTVRGKRYWGLANVGRAPTRRKRGPVRLEVNLFSFRGGARQVEVAFVARLREEKKFKDIKALKEQIGRDREEARRLIAALKPRSLP